MSARDRRIFLRDQERLNRNVGMPSADPSRAYGAPEPPPVQKTHANIFGDMPPVSSNPGEEKWQQNMAQRHGQNIGAHPPIDSSNLGLAINAQGFKPSIQANLPMNSAVQLVSPNQAYNKFQPGGQSPLRQSSISSASAVKQQSPVRSSIPELRRKQISDQVFADLMKNEPEQIRNYFYANYANVQPHVSQEMPSKISETQDAELPRRSGLTPRVQSAIGPARQQEVERLQRKADQNPFHKNHQNEIEIKRREIEKKREYAAMLQAQMNMKKINQKSTQQAPDVQYEQANFYPQQQIVDFTQFDQPEDAIAMSRQPSFPGRVEMPQAPQPSFPGRVGIPSAPQPYLPSHARPQAYALDQEVNFEPMQMQMALQMNQISGGNYNDPHVNRMMSPHSANVKQQIMVDLDDQQQLAQKQSQRSRQDEYRRQLEDQMKLNEEKKRRMKEDNDKYEKIHDKDMVQYMGFEPRQRNQMLPGLNAPNQSWDAPIPGNVLNPRGNIPQSQPQAIRIGSDITKPRSEIDPAKQIARLRYQEEIKQQMEEVKARKEAEKLREKRLDEEMERRLQAEQQRLIQQEAEEIRREGGKAPESKEAKKVRLDAFQPSSDVKVGVVQQPQFTEGDNFTLQGPSKTEAQKQDLFGQQPEPVLQPPGPSFGGLQQPEPLMQPPGPSFGALDRTDIPDPRVAQPGIQRDRSMYDNFAPPPLPQEAQFQYPPYQQHTQSNEIIQLQAAQMANQTDWMERQQQQANRIFSDQHKMIQMYQQALEQIMQYRQQSFDQVMVMRENLLKEREQNLENERLKQQQIEEMNQISALKNQLGGMLEVASHQKSNQGVMLNQQVTSNLNQYIAKQKDQILQMSQSQSNMSKLIQEAKRQQQYQQVEHYPSQKQQPREELPLTSQSIQIPATLSDQEPIQINFSPPSEPTDLQLQVEDIAAQIAANDIDQQNRQLTSADVRRLSGHSPFGQLQQPQRPSPNNQNNRGELGANHQLEQSLNSQSKMVKVPNQNLTAIAAPVSQVSVDTSHPKTQQSANLLVETWNEQSAKKVLEISGVIGSPQPVDPPKSSVAGGAPAAQSSDDSHRIVTPSRIGGNLFPTKPLSPSIALSAIPQTIQELPQEEEKPQNDYDGMQEFAQLAAEKKSEFDQQHLLVSSTSSPQRQLVSLEAREEMEKIE